MKLTSGMRSVAMKAKSVEELLKLAEEYGHEISKEDAEEIYAELNKEGGLADEELENVAGGGCYSSDPPHRLIVTAFNDCPGFKRRSDSSGVGSHNCSVCESVYNNGSATLYCLIRKEDDDPYR